MDYIKKVLNIVLINLIVFFALISIHEIGHAAFGVLLGCKYQGSFLMDSNFIGPYTEMSCSDSNYIWVFISGFLLTSAFSSLFLFLRAPSRNLFSISMGLSIVFSSIDMSMASSIQSIFYPMVTLGFLVTALGEYSIASLLAKGRFSLDLLDIEGEVVEPV